MFNRFLSFLFLIFIAISSVLLFQLSLLIWLLTFTFDHRRVLLHLYSSLWAVLYLWLIPAWSVTIEGRNKIRKHATYVIVSNHQSQLDILAAFRLFFPFKWVSKAEVFRIPFIGWNMVLSRYIKLKRGNKDSIRRMMKECEKTLADGCSVYIFPEGTRSETGIMKPFKPGAFILAKKMKLPILPIVINGSKNALPKHSITISGKHHIRLKVLDEIPYEDFANLEVNEISEMVRNRMIVHVDEHRATAN